MNHQQLEIPAQRATSLLTGYMKVTELEPGMRLPGGCTDHFGLTSRAELPAGVKIALVVDGAAPEHMASRKPSSARPQAVPGWWS